MLIVKMIDYSQQVLETLQGERYKALDSVGKAIEFYADVYVPKDTGRLANSIGHYIDDDAVVVGTNVQYGKYVEFDDTKKHKEPTRAHWLRDSVMEHTGELKILFTDELTR